MYKLNPKNRHMEGLWTYKESAMVDFMLKYKISIMGVSDYRMKGKGAKEMNSNFCYNMV